MSQSCIILRVFFFVCVLFIRVNEKIIRMILHLQINLIFQRKIMPSKEKLCLPKKRVTIQNAVEMIDGK